MTDQGNARGETLAIDSSPTAVLNAANWQALHGRRDDATLLRALLAERDKLRSKMQWIADRYSDSKTTAECAADAYDMSKTARAALGDEK